MPVLLQIANNGDIKEKKNTKQWRLPQPLSGNFSTISQNLLFANGHDWSAVVGPLALF